MYVKAIPTISLLLVAVLAVHLVSCGSLAKHNSEDVDFANDEHSLAVGKREDGDQVLISTEVQKSRSWLWWVSYDFVFPSKTNGNITLVNVTDLATGGEGGYPTITVGGPGAEGVTVHIKSRWNKGIDYDITVYGF